VSGENILEKERVDIIVSGGIVITVDEQRRIFEDGAIAISGNSIKDVGKTEKISEKYTADKIIDAKGKVVMPGFVDTHSHSHFSFLAELTVGEPLEQVWRRISWPYKYACRDEDYYHMARLAILNHIKSGTTCYDEMSAILPDGCGKAIEEAGIRCRLSRMTIDIEPAKVAGMEEYIKADSTENAIKKCVELIEKWNGKANGRIKVAVSPDKQRLASDELLIKAKEIADKYGVGIEHHLAFSKGCVVHSREKFGKREVEHLEDIGVLGPNFLGAHSVILSDKEVMLLAKRGAKIATSPVANTGYMQGIAKVPLMRLLGVTVSLGSDNIAGGTGNFALMKSLNFVHRGYWGYEYEDPFVLEPEDVLEIATIDGARALLWEKEIGSLEPGKKADIITVNLNNPHMTPYYDIVAKLTWVAENSDVDTVIIDGNVVMENRKVKTLDEEEVLEKASILGPEILNRSKVKKFRKPSWKVV